MTLHNGQHGLDFSKEKNQQNEPYTFSSFLPRRNSLTVDKEKEDIKMKKKNVVILVN